MQSLFKKFTNAVTNLVKPRTPVEELTHRWTELQAVNQRILDARMKLADIASASEKGDAASSRLRDGAAISETALWDHVKEHLTGILESLTAEQEFETGGRRPTAFSPRRQSIEIGSGNASVNAAFTNFSDSLVAEDDSPQSPRGRGSNGAEAASMTEHGACLEYFLQQNIMETICVMGLSNFPKGMMSLCLETAYLILKNVRQPLLPHHHVTTPICQLIYVSLMNLDNEASPPTAVSPQAQQQQQMQKSGWRKTRPTTEDVHREASLNLMSLVSLVWTKIWRTPHQLEFFTFKSAESPHAALLLAPIGALQLADSAGVGERARGCLTTILMLKNSSLENFIATHTPFCKSLATALADAFEAECSHKIDASAAENSSAVLVVDTGNTGNTIMPDGQMCDSVGRPLLGLRDQAAFLDGVLRIVCYGHAGAAMLADMSSCLVSSPASNMVDGSTSNDAAPTSDETPSAERTASSALSQLQAALVNAVFESFVDRVKAQLLQTSEAAASRATRELGQLVEGLAADHAAAGGFYPSPLLSLLGHAVIGALPIPQLHPAVAQHYAKNAKDTNAESSVAIPPDAPGAFVAAESASPLFLRRTLINRIDSVSEDLSVATVQLMLALLFCGSEQVRLAFLPRSFGNASPSMDCASSDAQTLKSGGSTAEGNTLWMPTLAEFFEAFPGSHAMWPTTQLEAPATGAAMAAAVAAVHQRQAFAAYLHDAQAQVSTFDMAVQSASHGKAMIIEPAASPTDLTRQELEIPEAEEWNFLRTLFRKMERILTQSVDESIALTAVFSALAVVTNIPQLHAKLFGTHPPLQRQSPTDGGVSPDVETSEDNRSLIDILIEIWVEAGGRLASVEDADEKLQWMRQSLGVAAAGGGGSADANQSLADQFETSSGEQRFLQAFVVLEEFIKELAAIVQAKRIVLAAHKTPI